MRNKLIQTLAVIGGLSVAGLAWYFLAATEGPQEEQANQAEGVLVATKAVEEYRERPLLHASGTVRARRVLALRPQVSGEITWINPALVAGGRLAKGEEILRIDSRDYHNRLEKAKAALARTEARLSIEKGRGNIAEEEWRYYRERNPDSQTSNRKLALRKPQLESVQAEIEERRAAVAQARLNLQRTSVSAPFDALVLEQSAARGLVVGPQMIAAKLVRSDVFDIDVKISLEKLPFISFPADGVDGAAAAVTMTTGGGQYHYTGRVKELVPAVEPHGRMAQAVVSVDDPLGQNENQPLLLGTFVRVAIETRLDGAYLAVPRDGVHYENQVYLYDDGRLRLIQPDIIWRLRDQVLVEDGVSAGDEVVVSPLAAPVEGMMLRRELKNGRGEHQP